MAAERDPDIVPADASAPYHQHRERFKAGVRAAITWLHKHAASMNDPKARDVLNSAAFSLGANLAHHPGSVPEAAPSSSEEVGRLKAENERLKLQAIMARPVYSRRQLEARVRELEEALRPFVTYADAALHDGMEGEIGEVYKAGFRVSIHTRDLRRARAALGMSQSAEALTTGR